MNKKQIDVLNEKINLIEASINNQTALFYRVVGEKLPVVVPEEEKIKFDDMKMKVEDAFVLSGNQDEQKFETALKSYIDYVGTAAPWIQENQSADLFELKYDLDYLKILLDYKKDSSNLSRALNELSAFILLNSAYSKIDIVEAKYKELNEEKIKSINEKSKEILAKNESDVENSFDYNELIRETSRHINYLYSENISDFMTELQLSLSNMVSKQEKLRRDEYINPITEKTNELGKKIDNYISAKTFDSSSVSALQAAVETQLLVLVSENLISDADRLRTKLDSFEKMVIQENNNVLYKKYVEDFARFVDSAKKGDYSNESYVLLQETVPFVRSYKPGKHDEDDLLLFEWKVFSEVNRKFFDIKLLLEPLEKDLSNFDDSVVSEISDGINIILKNILLITHTNVIGVKSFSKEVKNFSEKFNSLIDRKISEDNKLFLAEYRKNFETFKNEVVSGKFSQNSYSNLQKKLSAVQDIYPDEYVKLNTELEESKLYYDIKETISTCKDQINSMKVGIGETRANSIKISALNEQLASMKYNIALIKSINTQQIQNDLNSLNYSFSSKMAELEKKSDDENKQLVKRYNEKTLSRLKAANTENNRLNSKETWKGYKKDAKLSAIKNGKIAILKDLEKIDTAYLYPSVYTMYNQLYGQIWTSGDGGEALEVSEQFSVLDWSLTTEKWGLYDNF